MTPEQADEVIKLLETISENVSCIGTAFLFYLLAKIFGIAK